MQELNLTLFHFINAPADASIWMLYGARILAQDLVWLVPATLVCSWLWGAGRTRLWVLEAAFSGLAALLAAQIFGVFWQEPRPFMVGAGNTFLAHVADSSFPSDHLTLIWAVAFSLMRYRRVRVAGTGMALLGLPVAWARIYLGVHFPLDMAGAAVFAALAVELSSRGRRWLIFPAYSLFIRLYRALFSPLIRWSWVKK